MIRRRLIWFGMVLLCVLVLVNGVMAMSSTGFKLDWFVPFTGTGGQSGSSSYRANVTLGQVGIGSSESENYENCTGYWCGAQGGYQVFLSLLRR